MFRLLTLFFAITLLSSCRSSKSYVSSSTNGKEIYHTLNAKLSPVQAEFKKLGINEVYWIPTSVIDSNKDNRYDLSSILAYINKIVPKNYDSYLIIDWEREIIKMLKDDDKRLFAIDQMVSLVNELKDRYPKFKIGYYGLPFREYWGRNDAWKDRNSKLQPLFENVDVLFPSIYDFYEDKTSSKKKWNRDQKYVLDNVEEALRFGASLDIPVMPMVWHRYHDSNKTKKLQGINIDEFRDHVLAAFCAEVSGKTVDGIIWWSSEGYFENIVRKRSGKDGKLNLTQYLDAIIDASNSQCLE